LLKFDSVIFSPPNITLRNGELELGQSLFEKEDAKDLRGPVTAMEAPLPHFSRDAATV
jgi:hypothetical protein